MGSDRKNQCNRTRLAGRNASTKAKTTPCHRLPAGRDFMPQTRLKRLHKIADREKEGVEKSRLLAAIMRKTGKGIYEISGTLRRPYSTIRDWLVRMHAGGLEGRFNRRRRGRKRVLGNADLKKLKRWLAETAKKHGFESGSWHLDMIQDLIKQKLGIACKPRTLQRVLHKIHFSYRKARPVPHNSASECEQERFKGEAGTRIGDLRRNGYAIFSEDEATIQRWTSNGYAWMPTNGRNTIPTSFSKQSARMFCAVGEDSLHVWPADETNSATFVDILKDLHRKHPKFVMILDNASYHKSKMVTDELDSTDGIELIFLPPYTPQLNPTEIELALIKRRLAGRNFDSTDDLKKAITDIVDSGEVKPVKLMDYMLPDRAGLVHAAWIGFVNKFMPDRA